MIIAIPKETLNSETRVAATPETTQHFVRMGLNVVIESNAGISAGFTDAEYSKVGAIISNTQTIYQKAQIIIKIHAPQIDEISMLLKKQIIIADFSNASSLQSLADKKTTCFALERIPRISRAQTMDILTSQSNLAGYKAVINAATLLERNLPLMMSAAGTLSPAKVLVIGTGIAGLQAIATAKRLGAQVFASDIRPETKEQVISLGAKFIDMNDISAQLPKTNILITSATIMGKTAPKLITNKMLDEMPRNSVIIDMAAASGGNVEGIENNKTIYRNGLILSGNSNLAAEIPDSSSRTFSQNILNFLTPWFNAESKCFNFDFSDEIIAKTCIINNGKIISKEKK